MRTKAIRVACSSMVALLTWNAAAGEAPLPLGATHELFLDDYLIASSSGVTRVVQSARKYEGNPVLRPSEPWEDIYTILYGSVLRDGDRFRMWYYTRAGVCYAESRDGLHWTKPELDIVERDGRKTNIVVHRDPETPKENPFNHFYELFGVQIDPIDPDPKGRYKMGVLSIHRDYEGPREDPFHRTQRRGFGVASSPDGLHWELVDDFATEATCDGGSHWMYDPARKKFVLYGRTKHTSDAVQEAWSGNEWFNKYFWGRSVVRMESPNLVDWDFENPASAPLVLTSDPEDPIGTEIYSFKVFPYEGIYVGLVQAFYNQPDTCHLDIQLAVSRDGIHFERVGDRSPFIPVGGVGDWDRFNNSPANCDPIAVGEELWFYYGGRAYRHSPYQGPDKGERFGGVGLATIRRDRFCALEADSSGGRVDTPLVRVEGDNLYLNAKSDFGSIVVELLDEENGVVASSLPVREDGLAIRVEWEDGKNPLKEMGPARLRLHLSNAQLYSIWSAPPSYP